GEEDGQERERQAARGERAADIGRQQGRLRGRGALRGGGERREGAGVRRRRGGGGCGRGDHVQRDVRRGVLRRQAEVVVAGLVAKRGLDGLCAGLQFGGERDLNRPLINGQLAAVREGEGDELVRRVLRGDEIRRRRIERQDRRDDELVERLVRIDVPPFGNRRHGHAADVIAGAAVDRAGERDLLRGRCGGARRERRGVEVDL